MSVKLRAPKDFGSINLGGTTYEADADGFVEFADALVSEALSHGFVRIADALPRDPEQLSDSELRAHVLAISTKSINSAPRDELLKAVKTVIAAQNKPEGVTIDLSKGKPTLDELNALSRPDLFKLAAQLGIKAAPASNNATVVDSIVKALAEVK